LITPQLWTLEPPDRISFEIDRIKFFLEENGGRIKARTENTTFTKDEFKEKIILIAEKFVDAYTLSRSKYFRLGPKQESKSLSRVDFIIHEQEEGKPAKILFNFHNEVRVVCDGKLECYDKNGKLKSDSYLTEFDQNVELVRLSMQNETLDRLTRYFHSALRDIESLDFAGNLYKIVDALGNEFKAGRLKVAQKIGVSVSDLARIAELTNDGKYDKRHPPKQGEQVEPLSADEINDCIKRARKDVLAYVSYLKKSQKT